MLDYNLPLRSFLNQLNEIDETLMQNDHYLAKSSNFPYIPFRNNAELVGTLLKWEKVPFLDIGCGTGRILALRKYLTGSEVIGIEINADLAKSGMENYGVTIKVGDAFKLLTRPFLKNIRYIYTYMPICDRKLMCDLERQIEKNARVGSFRVEMYPEYFKLADNEVFGTKEFSIWEYNCPELLI